MGDEPHKVFYLFIVKEFMKQLDGIAIAQY